MKFFTVITMLAIGAIAAPAPIPASNAVQANEERAAPVAATKDAKRNCYNWIKRDGETEGEYHTDGDC